MYAYNNSVKWFDPLGLDVFGINTGGSTYYGGGGGASSAILIQSDGRRNRIGFVTTQEGGAGSGSGLFMHSVYGPHGNTIEGYANASISTAANLSWVSGSWSIGDECSEPYYELGLSLIPSEGVNFSKTTGQVILVFDYTFGAADNFYGDWLFYHHDDISSASNYVFGGLGEDIFDLIH